VYGKIDAESVKKIPGFSEMFKDSEISFCKSFMSKHWNIKPMKASELQVLCEQKGI